MPRRWGTKTRTWAYRFLVLRDGELCARCFEIPTTLNALDIDHINGDGLVDQLDFSFIATNFLDNSKDCCCPGSASLGNTVGRTEITVRELREQGMSDLAVADLNADGKVDMADMAALMQGVRPNLKANDGGKDGSRSNNRK